MRRRAKLQLLPEALLGLESRYEGDQDGHSAWIPSLRGIEGTCNLAQARVAALGQSRSEAVPAPMRERARMRVSIHA